ncbi:serine/threonine-protein kinase [Trichocoleus sp. FACHB-262]|uniref:serine/threonine-protein kinase n=1 Tax=Trichocoleus sp. FACHB-262 TaxID=2692869 RepID=UPI0016835CFB|nr:serine/threonine-protein kinase [Trichocoleus sp. FACHB-262]MBD2122692.1 serine/threonine protein kinase [Trichocoleus sp. FACHB-262]
MDLYCTRPGCLRPQNSFADLDNTQVLKTVPQKYCTTCGMSLILLGRYLPLKLLGKGGFGAAFLARDRYTPAMRQCVVKQFQPSGDLSADQIEVAKNLFEREAEVLEQLGNNHPQIPDLFAFFSLTVPSRTSNKQDEFFYLVQEFIDGQNMEEELAQKGQLSQDEVVEVLVEVLKILRFVHDNHSIHRDIKPSNIMRHRNSRIYLLDFGAVKKAAGATSKSSTGIYSTGYAPPEQTSGGQVYPATDLYALAVTCIHLLTGKEPGDLFDSYSNSWNWRSQVTLSDHLADVLDRMLLATPSQRFQSVAEVTAALAPRATPSVSPPPPVSPGTAATPPPPVPVSTSPTPPPPPVVSPPAPPSMTRPRFSTLELLGGAAFTGFEGGLIAIALTSLLQPIWLGAGVSLLVLSVLVWAQSRRVIEKVDLVIITGITLGLMYLLRGFWTLTFFPNILIVVTFAGLIAIAVAALFRLVYTLLSRFL